MLVSICVASRVAALHLGYLGYLGYLEYLGDLETLRYPRHPQKSTKQVQNGRQSLRIRPHGAGKGYGTSQMAPRASWRLPEAPRASQGSPRACVPTRTEAEAEPEADAEPEPGPV